MSDLKICSKCRKEKTLADYYLCSGIPRTECKACTIKRNVKYQRRVRAWINRFCDEDSRRSYMRDYYTKNKAKFVKYRESFKLKNPDYYKDYFRRRKEKK